MGARLEKKNLPSVQLFPLFTNILYIKKIHTSLLLYQDGGMNKFSVTVAETEDKSSLSAFPAFSFPSSCLIQTYCKHISHVDQDIININLFTHAVHNMSLSVSDAFGTTPWRYDAKGYAAESLVVTARYDRRWPEPPEVHKPRHPSLCHRHENYTPSSPSDINPC